MYFETGEKHLRSNRFASGTLKKNQKTSGVQEKEILRPFFFLLFLFSKYYINAKQTKQFTEKHLNRLVVSWKVKMKYVRHDRFCKLFRTIFIWSNKV